jgi:hypothetical protein
MPKAIDQASILISTVMTGVPVCCWQAQKLAAPLPRGE